MKLRGPLIALTLLVTSLPLAAQSLDWGMVGSAGIPDNGSSLYATSGPAVFIRADSIATLQIRYPVTNTYGSAVSKQPGWTTFSMTYSDNNAGGGSVVAILKEVDICTSTETNLCTLTSNDNDGTTQCDTCSISNIDFATHSYYIDVTIAKTDTPAAPKLYSLAIY